MKSLIVEPSLLAPILIPLGPKYWPQNSVSNTLSLYSSLNVCDHVSQSHSTTDNIIILYILIFKFLELDKTKAFGLNNNLNFLILVYILCPHEGNFEAD